LFFEKQGATVIMLQHKQSQEPTRHRPSKGLALAPINKGDKIIMTYKPSLKPWAIARLLPNQKWVIIGRYRSRNDADGHLQLCRL
jgi:hypothetical protein